MAVLLLGILDGHLFVVWRALNSQSADRHGCNRGAFAGHLSLAVIAEGRRLSGFGYALIAPCPVVERVIRRLFA